MNLKLLEIPRYAVFLLGTAAGVAVCGVFAVANQVPQEVQKHDAKRQIELRNDCLRPFAGSKVPYSIYDDCMTYAEQNSRVEK